MAIARKILKPALYLQALSSLVVGIVIFFLDKSTLTKAEPILGTRVGDIFIAYAVILVLVASQVGRDRRWLLVPIIFSAAEALNVVVEAIIRASGAHVRTDPMLAPPVITYVVFLVIYVLAYLAPAQGS